MEKHGSFTIENRENVLICRLAGAWNKEQAFAYQNALHSKVKAFCGSPWCYVVDASEFIGATPEAYQVQDQTMNWCLHANLAHRVMITGNPIQLAIAKKHLNTYSDIPTTHVCSMEQAADIYEKFLSSPAVAI